MPASKQLDRELIGMEPIQEILETAMHTATLDSCVPLSMMLIGPPGTGKSKVILQYKSPHLHPTNDITSQGLAEMLADDKDSKLAHIIIPDFNIVVSHKSSTTNLTVSSLLTIMSEGVLRIDDGRRKKELIHRPVGILTAMTREIYEEHAKRFRQLGIGRRFIPIHFTYSIQTRAKIQESIKRGKVHLCQLQPRVIHMPPIAKWPIQVEISQQHSDRIVLLSRDMAEALSVFPEWQKSFSGNHSNESWKIVPTRGATPIEFTPHMILRAMAMAHAVRGGRKVVKDVDIEFLVKFIPYLDYGIPVQL